MLARRDSWLGNGIGGNRCLQRRWHRGRGRLFRKGRPYLLRNRKDGWAERLWQSSTGWQWRKRGYFHRRFAPATRFLQRLAERRRHFVTAGKAIPDFFRQCLENHAFGIFRHVRIELPGR